MVRINKTLMKPGLFRPPSDRPPRSGSLPFGSPCASVLGRLNLGRTGGFGLYMAAFLFMAGLLSVMFFFPQYVNMRSGIYRISCKEIRKKVERAVADYDANNTRTIVKPGKRIDLDFLKETGYLGEVQYCPERGSIVFGPQGEVACTAHPEAGKGSGSTSRTSTGSEGE